MLVLERKSFYRKSEHQIFYWFPAAKFVYQNCTQIWRLHTKLYNGAWDVSANNSETVGHIDLRREKLFIYQSFVAFHFLGFFHRTVLNLLFCAVFIDSENGLSFEANFSFFSLAEGPPRDLQIAAYK